MDILDSGKISNQLILDLKGLQAGRMTLIVSSSSELNELLISTIIENEILNVKQTKHFSTFSGSFEDLRTTCDSDKKTQGLDVLAISEIQFFHIDDNISNHDHMSQLSRNLKHLSKELKCHVMVGLSIDSFSHDQMTFYKLREVGSLEVDSDIILFIEKTGEIIQVNIVKNRLVGLSKKSLAKRMH